MATLLGAPPAFAETDAAPQAAQPSQRATAEGGDRAFREQFRTWKSLDQTAAPPPVRAAAFVPARITFGAGPSLATITVGAAAGYANVTYGADADHGSASVTYGRAVDAAGMPVDFVRFQRQASISLSSITRPSGMPVSSAWMSSGFGMRGHPILGGRRLHAGIDLAAPMGTPIYATSDGVVSEANWRGGYGLLVALEHGAGLQTRYGHMSRMAVSPGQRVRKGEVIGYVGSTGRSTGPHVHYETRINGQAVNPAHVHRR